MTNVQSKFASTVSCTCKDFQHPWTGHCMNAIAGMMLASAPYCVRVYTVVYALSLIMHHRRPTLADLKKTLKGIVQSSCFLITNSYAFIMFNCLLRRKLGHYTPCTVAFAPAFLASLMAIFVERPARRPLLALYVSNVATEAVWRMAESRDWVSSLPYGETVIFGVSISILTYLYRLGLHKVNCKDSLFDILGIFVGTTEQGPVKKSLDDHLGDLEDEDQEESSSRSPLNFTSVSGLVRIYNRFLEELKNKHPSCPHPRSCVQYAVMGGLKPFLGGVSLQVALKLLLNVKKFVQLKMDWRKTILHRGTLKLGVFLGSFSLLYKAVSCLLRHGFEYDDPFFAIPAGLVGSIAFSQYPDITVALYVFWKMLQMVCKLAIQKGILPRIPGFTIILYCLSTATLFHAALLEPKNLRPSYYKFLQSVSDGRLAKFNFEFLDVFGWNTSRNTKEVLEKLNLTPKTTIPRFSLAA